MISALWPDHAMLTSFIVSLLKVLTRSSALGMKISTATYGWTCQHWHTCVGPFLKALSRSSVLCYLVICRSTVWIIVHGHRVCGRIEEIRPRGMANLDSLWFLFLYFL